ncbi:hypothetical protein ACFQ0K_02420 [Nocardioides caeni]|uniref:LPXTG cell wall anchor domain-containing protein n=1 Tax=Nocardioides caeni TaxID=574700 RepID=A0A4S8NSN7_9ACTN|nr:hypothetical protein [Nocardioides caeni]THV18309.1 hypothetical protein E9934_01350 [Nocardioides caeni]
MNAITRTAVRMIIATPLAIGAIGVGAGVAQAESITPGPGLVIVNPTPDPEPQPNPLPQGPGEIKDNGPVDPEPHPNPNPQPEGPGDIKDHDPVDPEPHPNPQPDGPDEITDGDGGEEPRPDDFTDGDGGQPEETPEETPEDTPADEQVANGGGLEPTDEAGGSGEVEAVSYEVPNRIDAGAGAEDGSMELAWLLAGGGIVTAAGAFAARRRLVRR